MKHTTWFVAVALVVLSGMAAAQLIGSTRVVAQVPFEFMIANKIVPAGECEVQAITMDGQTLVIRNSEAKVGLFSRSSQAEGKQNASNYAMVFKHYGDRYFLSGIKLQGSKIIYRLPESKVEAELRAQNVSATEETLRASLK
jgi:lipid-binding SYLF domain-containing protein